MFMRLLFILLLVLRLSLANACENLEKPVKIATDRFFERFPYWYNVALAKVESNCRWVISQDGYGSIGYFQLTPKFLDEILKPYFPKYKEIGMDYFYAFVFYLKFLYDTTPEKRLWIVYQRYNGGDWVLKECKRANSWEWSECKKFCKRGDICVWKEEGRCKQYRNACDINYEYSVKIYRIGQKIKKHEEKFRFW